MHTKDLFINNSSNRKTIETVCECFPKLNVVSSFALVIKPIDSVNACALVVSSEQEEVFWVFDFVSEKKADGFK